MDFAKDPSRNSVVDLAKDPSQYSVVDLAKDPSQYSVVDLAKDLQVHGSLARSTTPVGIAAVG
jgi:hypothetical protein